MDILNSITQGQIRNDLPQLNVGDTIKVHVKVTEGNREFRFLKVQSSAKNTAVFPKLSQ